MDFLATIACVSVHPGVVAVLYGRGGYAIGAVILSAMALVSIFPVWIFLFGADAYRVMLVALPACAGACAYAAVARKHRGDRVDSIMMAQRTASSKAFTFARRTVVAVVAAFLCLALLGAGLEALVWFSNPPIIRDIVGGFFRPGVKNGEELYRQRVRSAFPTNIPEAELLALLSDKGFQFSAGARAPNGQRYASVSPSFAIVCNTTWGVTWSVDKAGVVSAVDGNVYSACL